MAPAADWSRLVGYADRLSARPGESLQMMVSGSVQPEARVVSLPGREPVEEIGLRALAPVRPQPVVTGSHVVVDHDPVLRPSEGLAVSTWVWLAPGAPAAGRADLISIRDEAGAGWALVLDGRRPRFEVGADGAVAAVDAGRDLTPGAWTLIEAGIDPVSETLAIVCGGEVATAPAAIGAPGGGHAPLILGAGFDGKLDRPRIGSGPAASRTIAAWDLGAGRTERVEDTGPHGLHGRCVNGPLRAVTGHEWRRGVEDWRSAPEQYSAMHFHSDAVDDLRWEPTFELSLGESLESGVYALELVAGEVEDLVAFVVPRAESAPPATNVVLLPTFTYLAYSCELAAPAAAASSGTEDRWVAEHRMRSLYDVHADGVGVYEASLRRPLTQLRPGYACPQHGGPHGLAQDLILLDWLRHEGVAFDVVTDHDLDTESVAALAGHRTVITGAHPEYATEALLEALDAHLHDGGSLAYLGGNGLNGSVSVDVARPHVIELRRTETYDLAWEALPGEHHHASGDFGGDWRRRGRPEHRMLGVGLRAWGAGAAAGYDRPEGPEDPAAAIVFAGVEPGPIDVDGVVQGGPAGYEVDAFDPRAGSPPDAIVLATAAMGDCYALWPDDLIDDPNSPPPLRADMTLVRRPEGGAVFSVGSIAWTGCLGETDNAVSRVTANVLAELGKAKPFAKPEEGQTP